MSRKSSVSILVGNMNKDSTRYFSNRQEKAVAKAVGGRKVANSGATPFNKGDVTTEYVLIEAKTCMEPKQSFAIKKKWLEKNEEEAFAMRKPYHALVFDFGDGVQHYVIDQKMFDILLEAIDRLENE